MPGWTRYAFGQAGFLVAMPRRRWKDRL